MSHEKQVETFCRIIALLIRRLLTTDTTCADQETTQKLGEHSQSNG
jgi:hypothetical protein